MQTIVIAAGGTGGHFFPAEALASELIARGHRVALMTDSRSGGLKSAVFAGRECFVLPGAGIAGRGLWRGIKAVAGMAIGAIRARGLLSRLNAGAVVGFGGYPSVAPVLGASLSRRRPVLVLHEQNAVLGRANRFLSGRIDRLALSLDGTQRVPGGVPHAVTGNPVRPAIVALAGAAYAEPVDRINLLILGGSLGARVFSDVVPLALARLPAALRQRLSVTQQCRAEDLERVRAAYGEAGIQADLAPFFADVADRLASAHLVIARAGASTVAELAVAGRPSVLVPLPGAIDDHQTGNARALEQVGAALVVPQPVFHPDAFGDILVELLTTPGRLSTMAAAARTQARADAAARLADMIETLMTQQTAEART